jgi:hypothetical protein
VHTCRARKRKKPRTRPTKSSRPKAAFALDENRRVVPGNGERENEDHFITEKEEAMYTLVDYITHIKGIEYVLSLTAIAVFLVFWEVLKPRPFRTVMNAGKDDLAYIRESGGIGLLMKNAGKIVAAPFIGLAYIVMLPIGFFAVLASTAVNLAVKGFAAVAGKSMTFEWRPVEAYFAGRKKKKEKAGTRNDAAK